MRLIIMLVANLAMVSPTLAKDLKQDDIRGLAPGTYDINLAGIVKMVVTLNSDGTMTGTSRGKSDTGRWAAKGNRLCTSWDNWYGSRQSCTTLRGTDGVYSGGGMTMRKL